jgi:hypothetical protein
MSPSRAWDKIYVPNLELGNEKKSVGRASAPARQPAQAEKPVLLNLSFLFFQHDFTLNLLIYLLNKFIFCLVAATGRDVPPKDLF